MILIPKIIHQVWEGKSEPLPENLAVLAKSWKKYNPDWEYRLWNKEQMEDLVSKEFPDLLETYYSFPQDVQRWDAIRYMILYHIGGVYADLDSECLDSLDELLDDKSCCFGLEPPEHAEDLNSKFVISNAIMATKPKQLFLKKVITELNNFKSFENESYYVVKSTGPLLLNRVYKTFTQKNKIDLIDYKLVTPLTKHESDLIFQGKETNEIAEKFDAAYVVHYFFGSWYTPKNNIINNKIIVNTSISHNTFSTRIVIAHYNEDLSWINNLNIPYSIYTHDNSLLTHNNIFVEKNKGNEATLYLKYIIDNYNNLPDKILFVHGHQNSYHQENDTNYIANNLNWGLNEYFNIGKRSGYTTMDSEHWEKEFNWLISNYEIFEKYLPKPKILKLYPCAQFVVSKNLIKQYNIEFYVTLFDWLQNTELDNYVSGRIFEYMWNYLFTKNEIEKEFDNILK